jgi:2-amino-4-hydroxy-6-hydroxymethyldihydropteridine diphosphokinase
MEGTSVHRAWIGLGTNLGDRKGNLATARQHISDKGGRILAVSSVYESDPWGFESSNKFYNQCLELETIQSPQALLNILQQIEQFMGRKPAGGDYSDRIIDPDHHHIDSRLSAHKGGDYTDRIIDLDLLFYDDLVIQGDGLIIPHPGVEKRLFVLVPLAEISPEKVHPLLGLTIAGLLESCPESDFIRPVG